MSEHKKVHTRQWFLEVLVPSAADVAKGLCQMALTRTFARSTEC
jgi:hypothetical protein